MVAGDAIQEQLQALAGNQVDIYVNIFSSAGVRQVEVHQIGTLTDDTNAVPGTYYVGSDQSSTHVGFVRSMVSVIVNNGIYIELREE